jgi:hypothetical protein
MSEHGMAAGHGRLLPRGPAHRSLASDGRGAHR